MIGRDVPWRARAWTTPETPGTWSDQPPTDFLVGEVHQDPAVARHLVAALVEHVRRLRRDGINPPPGLLALLAVLASGGHGRPRLDQPAGGPDSARMTPLALDYRTAGEVLGVSERTARRLVRAGDLPAVRVAGCPRIRTVDLVAYVDRLDPVNTQATGGDHPR